MSALTGLGPMWGKEWRQVLRTHRLVVALICYALVGLGSPLLANLVPMLLALMPEDQLGGVELLITQDPGVTDAMVQYLKNFNLLPVLVVLLSMGSVANEKLRGTAPMLLAKPLSRRAFLLSKLGVAALVHLAGVVLAAAGCALYTTILFGPFHVPTFLLLNGLLLLGLWEYLALTLLASVLSRGSGMAAGLGLGAFVLMITMGALPSLARYTPAGVWVAATDLVSGRQPRSLALSLLAASLLIAGCLWLADRLFARQEL